MANGANGDKTQGILEGVGQELKSNPPAILAKTRQKSGPAAALSQKRAILLSKARRQGAQIPGAPGRMVGTR